MSVTEADLARWLIVKRGYFYRPNRSGYTQSKARAGRYTEAEARREAEIEPASMSAVHEDDAASTTCPVCGAPCPDNDERKEWHRSEPYKQGYSAAWKDAITWLHKQADSMADWRAKAILNSAAFSLGSNKGHGRLLTAHWQEGVTPTEHGGPVNG
jgi:hypothetical protein